MTREEIKRQRIEKGFCACDACVDLQIELRSLEEIAKGLEKREEDMQ